MREGEDKAQKKGLGSMIAPAMLCLCFIAASVIFLFQMAAKSRRECAQYLYEAANQTRTSILKQTEGSWEILEGLSVSLSSLGMVNDERIMSILKHVNERTSFVGMGFLNPSGKGWFIDQDGETRQADLGEQKFFQRARQGERSLSDVRGDPRNPGEYVNYYGVRIHGRKIEGVLCGVHSAKVLQEIIDAPVFRGAGYTDILDLDGDYVLKSARSQEEDLCPENRKKVVELIHEKGEGILHVEDSRGEKHLVTVLPLVENQWYQISIAPLNVLRASYIQTIGGVMALIVAACCLFIWMMAKQRQISVQSQKMLMALAYRDPLTGLWNFAGFKKEADGFLRQHNVTDCVIWSGDMKKFRLVNDVLGYEQGDRILKAIAGYLRQYNGENGISCRVSADHFVGIRACVPGQNLEQRFLEIKEYLSGCGLDEQFLAQVSLGVYRLRPGDEMQSLDVLANYANIAHKKAKEQAGSACVSYDDSIRVRMLEDSALEAEAGPAMEREEFELYMQPKIDIQNGERLYGAEILTRWNHPSRGMISPGVFIPIFERSDLIVKLDRYMFRHTCSWMSNYLAQGGKPMRLSVNVSRAGMFQKDFLTYYTDIKQSYSIPDGLLELEFTESMMAADAELFISLVDSLKERGFTCSMDDFGSGYSSLNLLKNLPMDVLKLDLFFFRNSLNKEREYIVVSNVIRMAKELQIKTVAEGVEDRGTVEFLRRAGCDLIQGYVYYKPMAAAEFERLSREESIEI